MIIHVLFISRELDSGDKCSRLMPFSVLAVLTAAFWEILAKVTFINEKRTMQTNFVIGESYTECVIFYLEKLYCTNGILKKVLFLQRNFFIVQPPLRRSK